MNLLDTDTLSLLMKGRPKVVERVARADHIAIPIVSRIEILQGRFASVLKAADGNQLLLAQHWLLENERYLNGVEIVHLDSAAAAEFDRLRENKKLRKIGRGDLLIACIALAHRATLVSRNTRDFQLVPGLRLENWAD
jgi:tRNA(fMet)-specific endonuclease VapC